MMMVSADSQSKESRKSGLSRQSNNTDPNSSNKAKRRQNAVAAIKQSKRVVMATMLPLNIMAGPENSDTSGVALEQTIISGVHLTGDGAYDNQIKVKGGKKQKKKKFNVVKDSCDIGVDDAMEGMIGGNFNTFGEQTPNVFFEKQKSVEEPIDTRVGGSENLIKRIEQQIEAELRDSKDASSALHPMFEVHELSNHSIGTHESNAIEVVAKPPQNTISTEQ